MSQNDVVEAYHNIVDRARHLRKTPLLEEVVRQLWNTLEADMVLGACKAYDVKTAGSKGTGTEIAIAVAR
jgi:hypothetical protein